MLAVIFELHPTLSGKARYLELAAELKPVPEKMDGFIAVERFQSLSQPDKFLSLSWWRDEQAIQAWHNHPDHQAAQQAGKQGLFVRWQIRVLSPIRGYGQGNDDEC